MSTILQSLRIRWILLVAILAAELLAITTQYERPTLFLADLGNEASGAAWLFDSSNEIWRLGLWVTGSCLLVLSPMAKIILSDLEGQSREYRWSVWIIWHFLALVAFLAVTAHLFGQPSDTTRLSATWFAAWFALASVTMLLWLLALGPGRFWLQLMRRERTALFIGTLLGIGAWTLLGMLVRQEAPLAQKELWNVLSNLTLRLVHSLLSLLYSDLIYEPEASLVGTTSFPVRISYACSGVEGISLITVFLAFYFWLFRKELCFPQAFWLFPLGIGAIWLANVVRIATLVAIGTSVSPEVALGGFHAEAGWVAFTLTALAAVALSHRMRFFTVTGPVGPRVTHSNPLAPALLVPLMVLMAASMATSASSSGFNVFYPVGVLATGSALWYFRKRYQGLGWSLSWQAAAIGAAVFLVWMLFDPTTNVPDADWLPGLRELPGWAAAAWLVFRVLGSAITVPLAEELAFRGYLLRKLVAEDFEGVPFRRFTWLSFSVSSIAFGMLHGDRWLAGTLAGMGFAFALYRRGQLGDAVAAHATTNALISIWVLTQGRWHLWS
ncbi:MAG: exosortase E/protease, VPEID-CTERM system [Gammaproteobacteria bacterium]